MFRVGVLENESEIYRHGWDRIASHISRSNIAFVEFSMDDLEALIDDLEQKTLDALIIATNAIAHAKEEELFRSSNLGAAINKFLDAGGGVFVSLQIQAAQNDVLKEVFSQSLEFTMAIRDEPGDSGEIRFPSQVIRHPVIAGETTLKATEFQTTSLNNRFARSIYLAYFDSFSRDRYEPILEDKQHSDRPLLIAQKPGLGGRLILSSVPLDWQGHSRFLSNIVDYIVFGRITTALMVGSGANSNEVDLTRDYLSALKVPYIDKASSGELLSPEIETVVLFGEIDDSRVLKPNTKESDENPRSRRIVRFGTKDGVPFISQTGGEHPLQFMVSTGVAWLRSQYTHGRWGGSFWKSFDAIVALTDSGVDLSDLKQEILSKIIPHRISGSYDEQFGATCAMAVVYDRLGEDDSGEALETFNWINRRFADVQIYEKCFAIQFRRECRLDISPELAEKVKDQVLAAALDPNASEDILIRGFTALTELKEAKGALRILARLLEYQASPGNWSTLERTAAVSKVACYLIDQVGTTNRDLVKVVSKSIASIRSEFEESDGKWSTDVSATSEAIRAIRKYEHHFSLPLDDVASTLGAKIRGHVDEAAIKSLEENLKNLRIAKSAAEGARDNANLQARRAKWSSLIALALLTPTVAAVVGFFLFIVRENHTAAVYPIIASYLKDFGASLEPRVWIIVVGAAYFIALWGGAVPPLFSPSKIAINFKKMWENLSQ